MHWWSCETCSNYTPLKKKADPLSWAESVCTCVQECVCVCEGVEVARLGLGRGVWLHVTQLNWEFALIFSTTQSEWKWSRTCDFSAGPCNRKPLMWRMCLSLYVYNKRDKQINNLRFWFPPSSFALSPSPFSFLLLFPLWVFQRPALFFITSGKNGAKS